MNVMPQLSWQRRRHSSEEGPRSFVVIATQGCGATWLMDRIDRLPGVQGHMELFYNDFRRAPARAGCNDYPRFIEIGKRFGRGHRPTSLFGYLDQFYSRPPASGFKLMYSQLREYPEILVYIVARQLPVLHLTRNRLLDAVAEIELIQRGQLPGVASDSRTPDPRPLISLDPASVATRVTRLERKQSMMRKLLKLLPVPLLELSFEDVRSDPSAFGALCKFIGVNADPADDWSREEVGEPELPHSVLANHEELDAELRRNGLGRFI